MSDIPDEILEKVARAICLQNLISTKQPTDDATMNSYWRLFVYEARAALTASGWGEMREALETMIEFSDGDMGDGDGARALAKATLLHMGISYERKG